MRGSDTPVLALRYVVATSLVAAWVLAYALQEHWVGDFWDHAAAVAEFQRSLRAPGHPILAVDAPSYFLSPYHLLWGALSDRLGWEPTMALVVAGTVNVLLLSIGTLLACRTFFGADGPRAALPALLLLLFFWGDREWFWSGFLHSGVLGYAAAYPATLALALSLIGFALADRSARSGGVVGFLLLTLLTAFLLITHPVTAVFAGLGTIAIGWHRRDGRRLVQLALALVGGSGLALLWPYYPLLRLLTADTLRFHELSQDLYRMVWMRAYPVLLAAPVVLWRLRADRRDPLAWTAIGVALVYVLGAVSGRYGLGRLISPLAITVQLALAGSLARLEVAARSRRAARGGLVVAVLVLGWLVVKQDASLARAWTPPEESTSVRFGFLREHLSGDDVVLADLDTASRIPIYGGKVVAMYRSVYWVDGYAERQRDVERFFAADTPPVERSRILTTYGVDFVLAGTEDRAAGTEVARNRDLVLYRVRTQSSLSPPDTPPPPRP